MKNLIQRFKRKLRERKEQAAYQSMVVGFGWAMTAFYLDREPLEEIKAQLSVTRDFGDWDSVDDGAQAAVEIIEGLGEPAYGDGPEFAGWEERSGKAVIFRSFIDHCLMNEATSRSHGNVKEANKWAFISRQYFKFASEAFPDLDIPTEEKLVHRLAVLGDIRPAPPKTERVMPHSSILVAIGPDHTAELIIDNESLAQLMARNGEDT